MTSCGCGGDPRGCCRIPKGGGRRSGRIWSFLNRVFCLRKNGERNCTREAAPAEERSSQYAIHAAATLVNCDDLSGVKSSILGSMSFTPSEQMLIRLVADRGSNPMGRFLTLRRRRKRRLVTRSLTVHKALVDDVLHAQCQLMLNRIGDWNFSAFTLDYVAGGHSLPMLCMHLFHEHGLLRHFRIDPVRAWHFFVLVEEGYRSNPYHNSIHATDVTQAMHCYLHEDKILRHLQPLEKIAALIAAMSHDLDHPGVTQSFLIATRNHLASLYKNASVLENHHWRSCIGCLNESCVLDSLDADQWNAMLDIVRSLILATDMARHQEFRDGLQSKLQIGKLDASHSKLRCFALCIALKCADISNLCRPGPISQLWSRRVCDEFYRQGDYERALGLPVTPICDRTVSSMPSIQIRFLHGIVRPLFELWDAWLQSPLSAAMMANLRGNERYWRHQAGDSLEAARQQQQQAAELLRPVPASADARRYSVPVPSLVLRSPPRRRERRHSDFLVVPVEPPSEAADELAPELSIATFSGGTTTTAPGRDPAQPSPTAAASSPAASDDDHDTAAASGRLRFQRSSEAASPPNRPCSAGDPCPPSRKRRTRSAAAARSPTA